MKVIRSVILLLIVVFVIVASYIIRDAGISGTSGREAFGVSPGTLTQLAANHVPTAEDIPMLKQWMKERQQGIWQMTESDLVGKAPMEYSILGSRIGAFA